MASSFLTLPNHTQRRNTVGRTPLDEWSSCYRDIYLTKHNTYNRQTSMIPAGFEPTISTGERPQTYALDRRYCPILWQNSWHYLSRNIHYCAHNSLQLFTIPRQLKSVQNIVLSYNEIRLKLPSHPGSCLPSLLFISDCWITFFMDFPSLHFVLFAPHISQLLWNHYYCIWTAYDIRYSFTCISSVWQ